MCIHQAVFFIKNNSNLSTPCNASTTDKIETDVIVTFDSSDVGNVVKVGAIVLYPDGIEHQFWSAATTISSTGTYDFVVLVNVAKFGAGTYSINGAETWNYNAGTLMCSGKPSGGYCQSLTVTSVGSNTINYSTFAKDDGSGGATEFESCTVSPSVATGNIKIMNQVTINNPGTSRIKNTFTIDGDGWYINSGDYNFTVGTYWVFTNVGINYEAGKTYVHTGASFV